MVEQSLLQVTLNTNRRRHSPRSEASQEATDLLSVLIQKSEFAIPGPAAYRCDVFEPGSRCPCFQVLDADGVSLVSFGVGLEGGLLGVSVDRLARPRRFSESQDQDTGGGSSSPDSLVGHRKDYGVMKQSKARMDELAEKLGILERGHAEVSPATPEVNNKKNENTFLRKRKTLTPGPRKPPLGKLALNPPHGEKDNFEKITVTLPSPIRLLLLDESHRRKTERDPNWSISVIVREALAVYLGLQRRDLHPDKEL